MRLLPLLPPPLLLPVLRDLQLVRLPVTLRGESYRDPCDLRLQLPLLLLLLQPLLLLPMSLLQRQASL
jgi:hypothetical protein